MEIYSISDLHLSINSNKPMDIFGPVWENYFDDIKTDWVSKVSSSDLVLLCGDLSWAMKLEEAKEDIKLLNELPGKKIIIKGNHDYWWQSLNLLRKSLPENFYCLQNDALKFENVVVCGTRGWVFPNGKYDTEENHKIFNRELIRLELSLKKAKDLQKENDVLVCMLHFPPVEANLQETAVTKLLEQYGVSYVLFGHVHGKRKFPNKFMINNVKYFLTSCDMVDNKLIKIFP